MSAKQLETISGAVEQVNTKGTGIKVLGEWLNVSTYHPIATLSVAGQLVEVLVERTDSGPWINSLRIIGDAPGLSSSMPTARNRDLRRIAALRSTAIYCGHRSTVVEDAKSSDVLKVANAWLKWLEQEEN